MQRGNKGLVISSIILMLFAAFIAIVPIVLAAPTADNFGVEDTNGYQNTNVLVHVNITNASIGPIAGIGFDISYNNSVISVVGIQAGSLTSGWDFTNAYTNYPWGTRVSIAYGGSGTEIGNGSTGSVAMLNFSVTGNPGETTDMNLSSIQLSDLSGFNVGTAPMKNGTFTVATTGGAQTWYLHNDTITMMYKGNKSKPEGTVTIGDGNSKIWRADEPATVDVGFPAGIWSGNITLNETFASGNNFTVEVGSYNGSNFNFTSRGSQTINGDGGTTYSLSISVGAFTINTNDYLALQISPSGAHLAVKTGGGNSYLSSPETDPGYPIPELSTFILFSIGLLVLAGYILRKRL